MAYEEILKYYHWYNTFYPVDPTPLKDFLRSGAIYVSGRTKRGLQPLIFLSIRKFIDQKISVEMLEVMTSYFLDFVINNYMLAGRVENWFMVIDTSQEGPG